jgi:hypothetical protein
MLCVHEEEDEQLEGLVVFHGQRRSSQNLFG